MPASFSYTLLLGVFPWRPMKYGIKRFDVFFDLETRKKLINNENDAKKGYRVVVLSRKCVFFGIFHPFSPKSLFIT